MRHLGLLLALVVVACDDSASPGAARTQAGDTTTDGGLDGTPGNVFRPDAERVDVAVDAAASDGAPPDVPPPDGPLPDVPVVDATLPDAGCVPVDERCNGVDDDCDGEADEDFADVGRACDDGVGACAGAGRWRCADDGASLVCAGWEAAAADEICNGRDDDCDGETDEDFPGVGDPCEAGRGACAAVGVGRCADNGVDVVCDAAAGQAEAERCDGIDNDCDGPVDEGFGDVGQPCFAGVGACRGQGIRICDGEGAARCDAEPTAPELEVCDGVDNDCDGRADEEIADRPCYGGAEETIGVGPCRAGVQVCVDGGWGPCVGEVAPALEVCDGEDNDCNGLADDSDGRPLTVSCYAGPEGTAGVGACRAGRRLCEGAVLGPCEGEVRPSLEICDVVDNDCNGVVDDAGEDCSCEPGTERECYGGPDGTLGVGACRAGRQTCRPDGRAWGVCVGQVRPAAEVCDGIDDDCDGTPDDGVEGVGEVCVEGVGACRAEGRAACDEVGLGCAAAPLPAAPEVCNGIDDDCDGATDEAFALGAPCSAGVGQCERVGATACNGDGEVACDATPGAPAAERCNLADDDCDGRVDEGLNLGAPCVGGRGACAREGVRRCGPDGEVVCDAVPGPPGVETCDGRDEDCDGRADEGFGIGERCEVGVGACRAAGLLACDPGGGTRCDGIPGQPEVEVCDGDDDDCDGTTDERIGGLGPCQADADGVCAAGRQACEGGALVCAVVVEPGVEVCNGVDDDCDGAADEDQGSVVCGEGICRRNVAACIRGAPPACNPFLGALPRELCNGRDDDCDGITDEDAAGDGDPCVAGEGGCARDGVRRCVDGVLACDAVPGAPAPERCNQVDDDCDRALDEDIAEVGQVCHLGVGECRGEGEYACTLGELDCLAARGFPEPEVCNGLDDDCDGTADEGFGDVVCGVGVCRHVLAACEGGDLPACDPLAGAGPEVCNGLDDDCDGRVDEAAAGTGDDCFSGEGVCRRPGRTVCLDARIACDAAVGAPGPELCNGADDDCDGAVDEDPTDVGVACSAGEGRCERAGQLRCVRGVASCDAQPGNPFGEACNGSDDDCDGAVDESLGTVRCGVGACAHDAPACAGGQAVECDPLEGAAPEACNGRDDDCDGRVDEDAGGGACVVGVGACRAEGVRVCAGGALRCDAVAGEPAVEACNDRDDDCDGRTDEGTAADDACVVGVGLCQRVGRTACAPDGAVLCEAEPGAPEAETCNLADDDCDGAVDEGLGGFGPCDAEAPGLCSDGELRCRGGEVACVSRLGPVGELCDGLDNDCDGSADEGLGTVVCGRGACARDIPACTGGAPTACDPFVGRGAETCDGTDEDCDGRVDEDAEGASEPCTAGVGACVRQGAQRCSFGSLLCDAVPGAPVGELCNTVDDDCDGTTDEDTLDTGIGCAVGIGACAAEAVLDCRDGQVVCPAEPGAGGDEVCNGRDDDCDGELDEGFGSVVCGVGRCRHAVPHCQGGQEPDCDPFEGQVPEVCNGVDDDCDGATDEDVAGVGGPCISGIGACIRDGRQACIEGVLRCDAAPGEPGVELCNGRDDDCDGQSDEDPADVGQACVSGEGACGRPGSEVCARGALTCDAEPGPPALEACNGEDDDCDGVTDEETGRQVCGTGVCARELAACVDGGPADCDPFVGAADEVCNGADDDCDGEVDEDTGVLRCGVGACEHEVLRCLAGRLNVCDPNDGGSVEVCNGIDDDCDGTTDEGVLGEGDPCRLGIGRCRDVGIRSCVDGAFVCDAEPGAPLPEACNRIDDDCDGAVDEDPQDVGEVCSRGLGGCEGRAPTECVDGIEICPAVEGEPVPEFCNEVDDDCDGLVDEHGSDCNHNGFGDECDLAFGRSPDCDGNGVPDECDGGGCEPDRTPPTAEVAAFPEVASAGDVVRIEVQGRDDRLVTELLLEVDDVRVPLDELGVALVRFDEPGLHRVVGIARDAGDNEGRAEVVVRILDPTDEAFPEVAITFPAPGARIEAITPVHGIVRDRNLVGWTLTWGPEGDPTANFLAEGALQANDDKLADFNPGRAGLGAHEFQLRAEDVNGRSRTWTQPFVVASCVAEAELCDLLDNDCDGRADEGFAGIGEACEAGVGECRRGGTVSCSADGQGTVCDARPGSPEAERCDEVDHDCDGDPRNGFALGAACEVGVGACARPGATVCAADGRGVECAGDPGAPAAQELCNGADDDCDGATDEGFQTLTCGLGLCRHTVSECDDGVPGGDLDCDPLEGAVEETCDGRDEDCDGLVDEHAAAEVCNGEDDDCDGRVDEEGACPDEAPPTLELRIVPSAVLSRGETATLVVLADDDRGVVLRELRVDGVVVPLAEDGTAQYVAVAPGVHVAEARVADAAGNEVTARRELRVLDPDDSTFPVAVLSTPDDDAVVVARTELRGTVTDANFFEYRISISVAGRDEFRVIERGRAAVVDGVLGVLDPTLLPSGLYALRLEAEDINGRVSSEETPVRIDGDAKIGHFRMTWADLTVPVAGVQLTVQRTYDSRVKRRGDFGVGWTLDVRSGSVTHNRPVAEGWETQAGPLGLPCGPGAELAFHLAEVRLNDREVYTFQPRILSAAILLGGCQVRMGYAFLGATVPGAATLDVIGDDLGYLLGNDTDITNIDLEPFDVERVRLTTDAGRVVDLHKVDGTFRVADANGNTLTIDDARVAHSSGEQIRFERDAQGRITAVVAPDGARVEYEYDAAGDLVLTRDREGAETRYAYADGHLLVEVVDALGNRPTRQKFDEDGRLVATVDAQGRRQVFDHDLDGRVETITDREGHLRVLVYDERGNVVREVGRRGQETIRTFDADDRKTAERDPEGNETTFEYDARGRLVRSTNAAGDSRTWTWDGSGRLVRETDWAGNETAHTWDARGNRLTTTDPEGHVTRWTYDAGGNELTRRDHEGNTWTYTYDALGRRLTELDPEGVTRAFTYDGAGNRLTESVDWTDADGAVHALVTRFEYDAEGRLTRRTDALGGETSWEYDALGNKVVETDPLGRVRRWQYDSVGNLVRQTWPDGSFESYAWDGERRRTSVTDRDGGITRYTYDPDGNIVRIDHPDGGFVTRVWDSRGLLVREEDALGGATVHERDALGRVTLLRDPLGAETVYGYDANGNQALVRTPDGGELRREHDSAGRLLRLVHQDGTDEAWTYDSRGNTTSWRGPGGGVTTYEYDGRDRLVTVTDPVGGVTTHAYDELGSRTSTTDANGRTTRYAYDGLGRLLSERRPLGGEDQRVYDEAGQLVAYTDFDGRRTTYEYDPNGALLARTADGEPREMATRTASGLRARYEDGLGVTTWAYDARGRLAEHVTAAGDVLAYTYDEAGRLARRVSPVGVVSYHYDAAGRLSRVTDPAGGSTRYGYDVGGNLGSVERPNGVVTTFAYDARQRLTELETRGPGGALLVGYRYTLGEMGERLRAEELHSGRTVDYEYDGLYRLVREDIDGGSRVITYTYDAVGNRLQRADSVEGVTPYAYDADDRLLSAGAATFEYDASGGLLRATEGAEVVDYTWDAWRRLVTVESGGQTVSYAYDVDGNRVRQGIGARETRYVIDPNGDLPRLVQTRDENDVETAVYVHGHDLLSRSAPGGTSYYLYDGQRSVRGLASGAGGLAATYDYDAFGREIGGAGGADNPFRYGGEYSDASSGHLYLRARWYSPGVGRFLSVDPEAGRPFEPATLHRYTYAENDPVSKADPSGRFTLASVSVSISISSNLRSTYTSNLVKTFLKVNKIAQCQLRWGANLRNMGITLLASGLFSGADLMATGQKVMATAFKAIGRALLGFYEDLANDLLTVKVTVTEELNGLKRSRSLSVSPRGASASTDIEALGISLQKYMDIAEKLAAAGVSLAEENDCADAAALEQAGLAALKFLPSF